MLSPEIVNATSDVGSAVVDRGFGPGLLAALGLGTFGIFLGGIFSWAKEKIEKWRTQGSEKSEKARRDPIEEIKQTLANPYLGGNFDAMIVQINRSNLDRGQKIALFSSLAQHGRFHGDWNLLEDILFPMGGYALPVFANLISHPLYHGDFSRLIKRYRALNLHPSLIASILGKIGSHPNFQEGFPSLISQVSEMGFIQPLGEIVSNPHFIGNFEDLVDRVIALGKGHLTDDVCLALGAIGSNPNFKGDFDDLHARIENHGVHGQAITKALGRLATNPNYNGDLLRLIKDVLSYGTPLDKEKITALNNIVSNPNLRKRFWNTVQKLSEETDFRGEGQWDVTKLLFQINRSSHSNDFLESIQEYAKIAVHGWSTVDFFKLLASHPRFDAFFPLIVKFDTFGFKDKVSPLYILPELFAEIASGTDGENKKEAVFDALIGSLHFPDPKIRRIFVEMAPFISLNGKFSPEVRDVFSTLIQRSLMDPEESVREAAQEAAKKIPALTEEK